jgi:hypothetical protein
VFWKLIRGVVAFAAFTVLGIISPLLVLGLVGLVNRWDDAPGLGFMLFGVGFLGAVAGLLAGLWVAVAAWESRGWNHKESRLRAVCEKALAALAGVALLPGAILSAFWTAHGAIDIVIGCGFGLVLMGLAAFSLCFVLRIPKPTNLPL